MILAARSEEELKARAAEIGGRVLRLDVTDRTSVADAAEAAGAVDILVNVAGQNIRRRFEEFSEEEYQAMMETNLNGIFRLTQKIGAGMIARGRGGKIVNIGSLMSISALPFVSVYAITKGGIAQMTRALAAEWARYNIQANCIAPGFILTDLNREVWERQDLKDWLKGCQANPNLGTPEDVAAAAVFLSGRGADYITGQVIAVDGGYTTTAMWPFEPQ